MGDTRTMLNKKTEVAPHGPQLGLANSEVSSPIPKLKGRQDSTELLFECVISMETLINDVLNNHANISLKSQETTNLRHYLRSFKLQSQSPDYLPRKFQPLKMRCNNSEVAKIRMNKAVIFPVEVNMLKAHAYTHLERLD